LTAAPLPISLEDARKVLKRRLSVHVSMKTPANRFPTSNATACSTPPKLLADRNDAPRMLMVGLHREFLYHQESWGTDWGDGGYCYVPKKSSGGVLIRS